ncbi:MAG TPA: NAD(+) diphosphatase [Candidatus Cybelea sp.]|nr:NAD(+) diphosphatase [Candidatus Cybelea sp.]
MNELRTTPAPIVFCGNPLDRVSHLRRDAAWLAAALVDRKSRFLPLWQLKALVSLAPQPALDWRGAGEVADLIAAGASVVMLGKDGETCRFAVDASALAEGGREGWGKFIDVRSIAPQLTAEEAGILAQARATIDWHARHRFCAVCGKPTEARDGGYMRACTSEACKAQHFPRTDPVVIMLILRGDMCLLGRQPQFLRGMYSALAGFIEPGETIENAVRREIKEEAGVPVGRVRYHASQPWPFPASLMIGCFGEATAETITVDADELEEARWFPRADVAEMLRRSTTPETPRMPPPLSLAHQLARAWIGGATV